MSAQNCRVSRIYSGPPFDYGPDEKPEPPKASPCQVAGAQGKIFRPTPSPITHQRAQNKKRKYGLLNLLSIIFNPFN